VRLSDFISMPHFRQEDFLHSPWCRHLGPTPKPAQRACL
jgi:hypothetical protein